MSIDCLCDFSNYFLKKVIYYLFNLVGLKIKFYNIFFKKIHKKFKIKKKTLLKKQLVFKKRNYLVILKHGQVVYLEYINWQRSRIYDFVLSYRETTKVLTFSDQQGALFGRVSRQTNSQLIDHDSGEEYHLLLHKSRPNSLT